ncbi:hypothetical protein JCM5353_000158 [Sporobolomyces roseus]
MHTLALTRTQAEAERSLVNLLDSTPTSSTSPPSLRLRQNSEGVQDATNAIDNSHPRSFQLGEGKWTWKVEQTSKYAPEIGHLRREPLLRLYRPKVPSHGSALNSALERQTEEVEDTAVVIDTSWQVPVLWFEAFNTSGSPLSLAELVSSTIFQNSASSPSYPFTTLVASTNTFETPLSSSDEQGLPFISQGEHPATGRPSWFLHPCETQRFVEEIFQATDHDASQTGNGDEDDARARRWIEIWLMVVGNVVDFRE